MYSRLADENAEDVRPDARHDADRGVGDERADQARRARDEVQKQRAAAAVAGRQQDGDVADLLRNFVRGDGDGGVDAERHRREHGRTDDRAVDEVVKGVADEDQRHRRAVHTAFVGVAVAQQHELLEHEKRQDAGQQRAEHGRRPQRVERFGQQRQQRDAEQRADGVADQPRHDAGADALREEQQRAGDQETAAAAEEAESQRCREQRHATF